jgi:tetratricopeptide (TPR) repeat protein
MKVAFSLRRRSAPEPAVALLFPSRDGEALLRLCARIGSDPLPSLFEVAGGFLLQLRQPTTSVFTGTVRLRALADHLLLPADADLVPGLLDDEATALVRQRGLVFLPGSRVLSFDPARPVPLSALLNVGNVRRERWQAFPERPALAERIEALTLDLPQDTPEAILESGGEWIATEEPRPPETSPGATAAGNAQLFAGRALLKLGQALGWMGLAAFGAQLIGRALSWVPRLSEAVLGRQEAALRELLRQFREGNLDQALRRALPLGEPGGRGGAAAQDARLPTHDPRYSLRGLLGGRGGSASIWFGGADLQRELGQEYEKAAAEATRRGDYRRAAFIYAKLLRDYRRAADVLARGGLHHDAAILYLEKVGDRLAAARSFAAAGEIDRAVELYRQESHHVEAGDLLRQNGEEEAAIREYEQAAELLVRSRSDRLAAGELLLHKAGRPDLALPHFEMGWALRPAGNAVPCGLHLQELYAPQTEKLLALVDEADEFFSPAGNEVAAGQFYNALAHLADRPNLAQLRDDLRDRALLALALKLRQSSVNRRPNLVSALLGESNAWSAATVSDARFAVQRERKQTGDGEQRQRAVTWLRVAQGTVTAVCSAWRSGAVFLGFADGKVVRFEPGADRVETVCKVGSLAVTALATDPEGELIVMLHDLEGTPRCLLSSRARLRSFGYRPMHERLVEGPGPFALSPVIVKDDPYAAFWNGESLELLWDQQLHSVNRQALPGLATEPLSLLLFAGRDTREGFVALIFTPSEGGWFHMGSLPKNYSARLPWSPGLPEGSSLTAAPLSWLRGDSESLEVAGLLHNGAVCWSLLPFGSGPKSTRTSRDRFYLAATLIGPGLLAAVAGSRIDWLRCSGNDFPSRGRTPVAIPGAVACFACHETRELIVVCRDGFVVRVPLPS